MSIEAMRHSAAHIMAAAVREIWKDAKLDIGPATDDGFYYDFDLTHRLSQDDFTAIEAKMTEIVKANLPFERIEVSRAEAAKMLADAGQPYKLERLADIPEGDIVTFYKIGTFFDLCRGPHLATTGEVKAFKITAIAGSYFRGDEKNPMLQRLYGIVAESQAELDARLAQIEEAKKRDHRKLGAELDLFSMNEEVGAGLVLWHPKGARIRVAIEDFWRREHLRAGYQMIFTPHIGKSTLWETSGHLGFYKDSMYSPMDIDGQDYIIKPMNCPFHIEIFKSQLRSYRDLPLRWCELGTVYRYEKSGVLHGLLRVRGFTQDDAHIFCAPEDIESEIRRTVGFALGILRKFGFNEIDAYLSTRPEKAVGEPARWEQATNSLRAALEAEGIAYQVDEGGGAFYGPKIDLKIKDAIGRQWQLGTVQFDFNMSERFDITYIGSDGQKHRPYMVHRALLGSIERFFGILVEHYAGSFPVWLAPEQIRVLPVKDAVASYAREIEAKLLALDARVTVDTSGDRLGAMIRRAGDERVPFKLVVGEKEAADGTVSVRYTPKGDMGVMTLDEFAALFKTECEV
ncbi:MAG: threonine--tRNA ligase [Kiritimatiellaeota bacterium]|nr:threonine--tRNA ligase [Kiritimatiellota bacterium]